MSDERAQRLIAQACLTGTLDLRALAREAGLPAEDLAAFAAAPSRLALYRRLIRNNLLGVTAKMMPRTRGRLNDARDGEEGLFDASFDAFLADVAPRTHYLRDVPAEFVAWARPRWEADGRVPRYAHDLACYELVHFQIAAAPRFGEAEAVTDIALDRPLVFCGARRLVHYAWAVQALPEDEADRTAPAERPSSLVVYRDAENLVRFLELTPLAAGIVRRLFDNQPLGTAVIEACADTPQPVTPDVLSGTASLLSDWAHRGLLIGARRSFQKRT